MKMIKIVLSIVALVAATTTTAHARDSISIGVNIGGGYGHGYSTHSIGTHRHAPALYGYYGAPIVHYSAQPVVYYAPAIRYNHYEPRASYGRDYYRQGDHRGRGDRHHNRHGDSRRHHGR